MTEKGEAYAGSVSVFSDSGIASRLPLTVTVRKSNRVPPEPLVSSVSATAYSDVTGIRWRDRKIDRASTPDDDVTLWVPVKRPSEGLSTWIADEVKPVVGAVSGPGGSADVTYVKAKAAGPVTNVGLHVDGLPPGSYEGKVDLNPADEKKGDVELSVTAKDSWPWAALTILAGLVLASAIQHGLGVRLPRGQLREDADALRERLRIATQNFRDLKVRGIAVKVWPRTTFSGDEELGDLNKKITTKTRGAVLQIDPKVTEALRTAIESLGATIDSLPKVAANVAAIEAVLDTQPKREDMPARYEDVHEREPFLAREARKLVHRPELSYKVSEIEDLLKTIDRWMGDTRTLVEVEARISNSRLDWETLERELPTDEPCRSKLPGLESNLESAWHQVWNAASTQQLSEYAKEITKIETALSHLWPLIGDPADAPHATKPAEASLQLDEVIAMYKARGEAEADSVSRAVDSAEVVTEQRRPRERPHPLRSLRLLFRQTMLLGYLAVALAVVLAVLTGLSALYIDNPWGSNWDYIAAFTWGLVAPPAFAVVGAALNKLGESAAIGSALRRG